MIPAVSAGSNQVGASVTWTAQVSSPSGGPEARMEHGTPNTKAMARVTASRHASVGRPALPTGLLRKEEGESIETVTIYAALYRESARRQPFRLITALASIG